MNESLLVRGLECLDLPRDWQCLVERNPAARNTVRQGSPSTSSRTSACTFRLKPDTTTSDSSNP